MKEDQSKKSKFIRGDELIKMEISDLRLLELEEKYISKRNKYYKSKKRKHINK